MVTLRCAHTEIVGADLRRGDLEAHERRRARVRQRRVEGGHRGGGDEARVARAHHRRRRQRRLLTSRLRDRDAARERRPLVLRRRRELRARRPVQTAAAAAERGRDAVQVRVLQREMRRRVDRVARDRSPAQLTRQVHVHVLRRLERQLQ